MTTTASQTLPTAQDIPIQDAPRLPNSSLRQSWTCNSCHLSFHCGQDQRVHMKSPWHVYNLKRRLASLPPISSDIFEAKIQTAPQPLERTPKRDAEEERDQAPISPHQCLFCHLTFEEGTERLDNVIEHMFNAHGLFIPDQIGLLDPASFLNYLATQVRIWNECLYCGITRTSTPAIQSHMRDSGHCMLNLEREPELVEFWERSSDAESDATVAIVRADTGLGQEIQLVSGRRIASKAIRRPKLREIRANKLHLALQARPEPSHSLEPSRYQSCRQLGRRDEMGIQNISPQQRHDLVLAQKRSQKDEAMATRAKEWIYSRNANDQKHDQAYGPLAWAKGGMHNLLPR